MRLFLAMFLLLGACTAEVPVPGSSTEALGSSITPGSSHWITNTPTAPGFPEGLVVRGNYAFVSGAATGATAGVTGPSAIWVVDLTTETVVQTFVIQGEDLTLPHAAVGMAMDLWGYLYLATEQLHVVRLWPWSTSWPGGPAAGDQSIYATLPPGSPGLPGLPPCASGAPVCTNVPFLPPTLNDLAFDWAGNLYMTDMFQGVIYRVPSGGGVATPWLADPRFEAQFTAISGDEPWFGVNGIEVDPTGSFMVVTTTGSPVPAPGEPTGKLYRIPIMGAPTAADVTLLQDVGQDGPDGVSFAFGGQVYVSMAFSNRVAAFDSTSGVELESRTGPADLPSGGTVPWLNPAQIAFDGFSNRLLVVNHALIPPVPSAFGLFDVGVSGTGALPVQPPIF